MSESTTHIDLSPLRCLNKDGSVHWRCSRGDAWGMGRKEAIKHAYAHAQKLVPEILFDNWCGFCEKHSEKYDTMWRHRTRHQEHIAEELGWERCENCEISWTLQPWTHAKSECPAKVNSSAFFRTWNQQTLRYDYHDPRWFKLLVMISGVLEPTISETALEAREKELLAASTIHKADEHFRRDVLKLYDAIDNKRKVLKSQLGQAQHDQAQRNRAGPFLSNPAHLLHRHPQIYFPHPPPR